MSQIISLVESYLILKSSTIRFIQLPTYSPVLAKFVSPIEMFTYCFRKEGSFMTELLSNCTYELTLDKIANIQSCRNISIDNYIVCSI